MAGHEAHLQAKWNLLCGRGWCVDATVPMLYRYTMVACMQADQSSNPRSVPSQDQAVQGLLALIHGWPMSMLASRLGCAIGVASSIMKGLLASLPQLTAWRARIEALDCPSCALPTLSGRHITLNCKVCPLPCPPY